MSAARPIDLDHPRVAEWEGVLAAAVSRAREYDENRRAQRDAMIAIARDIPDPAEYAQYLSIEARVALLSAWQTFSGMRLEETAAAMLRPAGLCEFGGRHLTAFGMAVRRAVIEDEQA